MAVTAVASVPSTYPVTVACLVMISLLAFTYTACIYSEHCPPLPNLPSISMTWEQEPGSYVSRFVVSNVAFGIFIIQPTLWAPEKGIVKDSLLFMAIGFLATILLAGVAAVCDVADPTCYGNASLHYMFAISFFFLYNMNMLILHFSQPNAVGVGLPEIMAALSSLSKVRYVPSVRAMLNDPLRNNLSVDILEWTDTFFIVIWTTAFVWQRRSNFSLALIKSSPNLAGTTAYVGPKMLIHDLAKFTAIILASTYAGSLAYAFMDGRVPAGELPSVGAIFVTPPGNWLSRYGLVFSATSLTAMTWAVGERRTVPLTSVATLAFLALAGMGSVSVGENKGLHTLFNSCFFVTYNLYMVLRVAMELIAPSPKMTRGRTIIATLVAIMSISMTVFQAGDFGDFGCSWLPAACEWANTLLVFGFAIGMIVMRNNESLAFTTICNENGKQACPKDEEKGAGTKHLNVIIPTQVALLDKPIREA